MLIKINGQEYNYPMDLREVTLGQRIAFQKAHGDQLDAMLSNIIAMPGGFDQDAELTQLQYEKAFRHFSFFTGIETDVLKDSPFSDYIVGMFLESEATMYLQEKALEEAAKPSYHVWDANADLWVIHRPELNQASLMTFGEVIDAKQRIKDLADQQANRWESLLPLCAIFLRRQNEPYNEAFLYEGSERLKHMESLPLDIAIEVGFFLTSFPTFATNILPYFSRLRERAASFLRHIFNAGGGFTSLRALPKKRFLICQEVASIPYSPHEWPKLSMC